ncbi:unnamed protein product [Rhizoctonia solani]|uniref:Uncharacterized protein n=1 Tax=Rhizoctonia solani TaxID=456999 RepID=A0A8H3BVC1_9AGAM|nr:unnamed protein product [Rhizoctonia solani]
MVRRSPFSPINIQRRRPRPAALDLAHSAFSPSKSFEQDDSAQFVHITHNGPYFCGDDNDDDDEKNEQARASAELAHTQAVFTASLESEPIPGVRARSPVSYRTAGKALPMEVEVNVCIDVEGRPSLDEYRLPLPTGDYKFPPVDDTTTTTAAAAANCCQLQIPTSVIVSQRRPSVETPTRRNGCCAPLSWMKIMRALRTRGRRRRSTGRKLPEPVGFHERIAHAEHEWRPTASCAHDECEKDKGRMCLPEVSPNAFVDWPWR